MGKKPRGPTLLEMMINTPSNLKTKLRNEEDEDEDNEENNEDKTSAWDGLEAQQEGNCEARLPLEAEENGKEAEATYSARDADEST